MSLTLERPGTKPRILLAKAGGSGKERWVLIGKQIISLGDFLDLTEYVLTNTDLIDQKDPRLQFIKCVKAMHRIEGYNGPGTKRLFTKIPPVPE